MQQAARATLQRQPTGKESAAVGPLTVTELQAMDAYWRASNI
jgi:hypothetical protein